MSDLEDKLRELAARGELTHMSITPRDNGVSMKQNGWRVIFTPASTFETVFHTGDDLIKTIKEALDMPRLKSRRPKVEKPADPHEQEPALVGDDGLPDPLA